MYSLNINNVCLFFSKVLQVGQVCHGISPYSIENEQCSKCLLSCKSIELHNQLIINLGLGMGMLSQKFYTLHNFWYVEAYN
jgi:hypothetical protein